MRTALTIGIALAALALGSVGAPAAAQSRGYAVNRHDPAEPGGDWYATESLDLRGAFLVRSGAVFDWAYRPLRVPVTGERVLVDQVVVYPRADVVLASVVRLGVGLPVTLYQHGDVARTPAREQALGDLRLVGDVRLFGTYNDAVRAAIGVALYLPTGDRDAYASDGMVRIAPRFLLAGSFKSFEWGARLGYHYRPFDHVWAGRVLGDDVTFGLSAGLKVNDRFVFGPELHGNATVTGANAVDKRSVPIEALLGARVRIATHFQAGTAIGGGLTTADGAPKMRVLAMFEYAPDVCVDKDGDGICAYEDACPEADGARTNDRRTNGCPVDRDHDGVPDAFDVCPDVEGGSSTEPTQDGCPPRSAAPSESPR